VQGLQAGNGCISAHPDLVEDATGETVQFPPMARSLSPLIRFGTSTWTYEGWQAQIYLKQYNKTHSRRNASARTSH